MDFNGKHNGPTTRHRARANKLAKTMANRSRKKIENSKQTIHKTFEAHKASVNQNEKTSKRKRGHLAKEENETLDCEPVKTSDLTLLDILNSLVCRNHVLSFLHVNDLLRLRRVCKRSKKMTQNFIRIQKVSTQQPLNISFRDRIPFHKFNQFESVSNILPIRTSLQVTFGDRPPISKVSCTNNITHLTILNPQLSLCRKSTLKFLETFSNVTHLVLHLDHVQVRPGNVILPATKIPETFKNLISLIILIICDSTIRKFRKRHISGFGTRVKNDLFLYIKLLVEKCITNLNSLSLPFHQLWCDKLLRWDEVVALANLCLFSKTNLKLEGFTGELVTELLKWENRTTVMRQRKEMIEKINAKIVSIDKPNKQTFLQKLPNLERINFKSMSDHPSLFPVHLPCLKSDWSKLKEIRVHFQYHHSGIGPSLGQVWDFLFVGIVRENVVELHISFAIMKKSHHIFPKRNGDILTSCPNLKTLYINSMSWQLFDLPQLWRGLPRLEKLHFGGDSNLTDDHFIGKDSKKPAFWELKSLKVLELADMDEMAVTDDVFSKVICQMPLKELHLSGDSECEVKSITLKGIKSLLSGKFASTVEKISMEGLKIRDTTQKSLKCLKNRFRSSQMC